MFSFKNLILTLLEIIGKFSKVRGYKNQSYIQTTIQKGKWNSNVVQWLGICALTAEGPGSILGQRSRILQAVKCSQKQRGN